MAKKKILNTFYKTRRRVESRGAFRSTPRRRAVAKTGATSKLRSRRNGGVDLVGGVKLRIIQEKKKKKKSFKRK
ncbi:hypothetical protein HY450_03970 [Candidatus Pacearchaeota archaeon]|nr:hypothetical protein [Candidatus Pacearchaeota archaeon]